MWRMLIYGSLVHVVVCAGICLIQKFDDSTWKMSSKERGMAVMISGLNGILAWGIFALGKQQLKGRDIIFLALFAGCLLFACITDLKKCVVFQFIWWTTIIILGAWFIYRIRQNDSASCIIQPEVPFVLKIGELLLYILLQEFFFCRMYGRADCHGFSLCAVALFMCGINMSGYVYHMAIAFGMLGIIQLARGNVNRRGNLKKPVPFLPYITLSFWLLLYIAFFPKEWYIYSYVTF